jgi:hypothetical protein
MERRPLPPLQGGKLTSKDIFPSREKEAYERRLETCPEEQDLQACGERIPWGDLLSPPGNTHGGHAVEVHYDGLTEGIITATGTVITDKTGWSSPIGAVRQTD